MFYWLFRQFKFIRKALPGGGDTPRQLAYGFALGLMLGLIPKGNLIAVAIATIVLGTTVNLGIAMITAVVVSFLAIVIDPLSHQIGAAILSHESLQPHFKRLYETPLVPWTRFNNTVVAGAFALGAALFYPAYRASFAVFARYWVREQQQEGNAEVSDRADEFADETTGEAGPTDDSNEPTDISAPAEREERDLDEAPFGTKARTAHDEPPAAEPTTYYPSTRRPTPAFSTADGIHGETRSVAMAAGE